MNAIYTVTVLTFDLDDQRTWGWFSTFEQAHRAALYDQTDMRECLYAWVCIEEIPSGIGCGKPPVWWGRFDEENNSWVGCATPTCAEGYIGFAMG